MLKLKAAFFLRFAPALVILLTSALAPITAEATVAEPMPTATGGSVGVSTLQAFFESPSPGQAALDISGMWTVIGSGSSPVTTSYDYVYPVSVALTTLQSYQITNRLDMELLGVATSGSYSATTYLDSSSTPGSHLAGAFATASGTFTAFAGILQIPSSDASTTYLLTGASGPYYLEQDVTVSLSGVGFGQDTIELPNEATDDSTISPVATTTTAVPEPVSFTVWAGLGIIGVIGAWRGTHARSGRRNVHAASIGPPV